MPNIKSSAKRDALQKAANAKNKAARSALKTELKKFDAAVAAGDGKAAAETYKAAVKSVDKAAAKGLIHKNNAATRNPLWRRSSTQRSDQKEHTAVLSFGPGGFSCFDGR